MSQSALLAHDLIRTLGSRRVLDGISLTVAPGRRLGVIGDNGAGKSTLLRLLAGLDTPDAGTVERPSDIGFLPQEMPFDPESTIAAVLDDALRDSRDDLAALDRLTRALTAEGPGHAGLLAAYGERLERAQDHDAWDADRRAELALGGLGLAGLRRDRRLGEISGGQRARLAVAALLVRRPPALVLDEPTNHLDDEAAEFLERQLREVPGVVVLASHDRTFLDAVRTDLIDLDPAPGGPAHFGGNYTEYLAAKQADRQRWEQRHADEQEELRQLRHAVAVTAHGVAHGRAPRDHEKMGYDHTGGRVQNQVSHRVRAAARRLADLERPKSANRPRRCGFGCRPGMRRPRMAPCCRCATSASPVG